MHDREDRDDLAIVVGLVDDDVGPLNKLARPFPSSRPASALASRQGEINLPDVTLILASRAASGKVGLQQ